MTEYSPLQAELTKLIKSAGPMPVWRYMELCLTHPRHGYYVSRDPLGREGDFTTAPEVSQMFGELLGLWAASVWKAIGSPPLLRLIELGPGRGTMMADALRALRVLPPLHQALSIHLVEINPVLRKKQKSMLSSARSIAWHDNIDDVPEGPAAERVAEHQETQKSENDAEIGRQPQRHDRERGQRVEGEAEHAAERIIAGAAGARRAVISERDLAQADPAHHAANEALLLRHGVQNVKDLAAHQPEITGVDRHVAVGKLSQQPIE